MKRVTVNYSHPFLQVNHHFGNSGLVALSSKRGSNTAALYHPIPMLSLNHVLYFAEKNP